MKTKICIWMNIPSHHQSAFFDSLSQRAEVELKVIYLNGVSRERVLEGWNDEVALSEYESCINGISAEDYLYQIKNWKEFIHVTSYCFTPNLIQVFIANKINWFHWSERSGFQLASMLHFNACLFQLFEPLYNLYKRLALKKLLVHSRGLFCQGKLAKKSYEKMGIDRQKLFDLFYSPKALVKTNPNKVVAEFSKGRKVFLCVASLCYRKGIDILLAAMAKIDNEDCCLVFCGYDSSDGIFQRTAEKLRLQNRVLFLGAIDSHEINGVYCASDVFVLPSRFDGWGAVLNEAASVGLPIISTCQTGAAWHLIHENKNGYLVKAGSIPQLKDAMLMYINNPELVHKHGSFSFELFQSEFLPEKNCDRLISVIQSEINKI